MKFSFQHIKLLSRALLNLLSWIENLLLFQD